MSLSTTAALMEFEFRAEIRAIVEETLAQNQNTEPRESRFLKRRAHMREGCFYRPLEPYRGKIQVSHLLYYSYT